MSRTCLVTGGTSGIGRATALRLVELGDRVIVVGRNSAAVDGLPVEFLAADLSTAAGVRQLADEVQGRCDRLDVLVNNAGVITMRRQLTADGIESTFAVNHLAPFLLTNLLRDLLERSAPARIVTVSSGVHKQITAIPWDDLAGGTYARHRLAYPLSKLSNLLFTAELARRLAGTGVTANCLHPGFIRTSLGRDASGAVAALLRVVLAVQPGPDTGARTSVYLASSPEVADVTGGYFVKCTPAQVSALAADSGAAARLWTLSAELTGL